MLPATRQRWHSRLYPSRSWYSIKRPQRDARLSWPSWLVTYRDEYTRPKTVTRPSTNWARRALTSFKRRTPLTTTLCRRVVALCHLTLTSCYCWQLYCIVDLLRYATAVCCQLCRHLNIRCFHIALITYDTESAFVKRRLPSTSAAPSGFSKMPPAILRPHASFRTSRTFHT